MASAVLPGCAPVDALNALVATDGVVVTQNIAYAPGPRGGLDLYRPAHPAGRPPLVVFIYGGSWQSGRKDDYRFVAAPLAQAGLVVAVPDYRLSPEVRYPDFLRDCADAVAFAKAHAGDWGADPDRLFLVGHSAGGYNALMLALDARWLAGAGLDRSALAGVVGISAPANFLPIREDDIRAVFAPAPTLEETQPINHVDSGAPPVLLLHGEADRTVAPRNSLTLAAKLREAGVPVQLRMYPGVGHITIVTAFTSFLRRGAPTLSDVVAFTGVGHGV